MSSLPSQGRTGAAARRYLLLFVASLYPFATVYGTFAGVEPLDSLAVTRTLAGSCVVSFLSYGLARFIVSDPDARALWLGIIVLAFGAYSLALGILAALGLPFVVTNRWIAVSYSIVVVALVTYLVRPWRHTPRDLVPLLLVAMTLSGFNMYRGAARLWSNPERQWKAAADAIVAPAVDSGSNAAAARDIYYIVLDGFGRADSLREEYNLDLQNFVAYLQARGFYVPEQARSNYAHTLLSFSSFLNLGYLDSLGSAMGRQSTSWLPLADLIQRNALMRLAKDKGFSVTAIGSSYGPTKRFTQADECVCRQYGLDLFEQTVLEQTPFGALPLDPWTYGAHQRKILDAFGTLEHLPEASSGRFILVHILSPHPPFIFAADGTFHRPDRSFRFSEGSDFPGSKDEYVQGYRAQTEFIVKRLRDVVEAILGRPGARPVIILHGDHGPGSMLQLNDSSKTNLAERMDIFAAYYFPDGPDQFYPSISPVNGARALANRYFGASLPPLPDQSWFSTEEHPYDFTMVPVTSARHVK